MRTRLFLTALLSLSITLPVQAQVYKWKDAQGRTIISDVPQTGGGKQAPTVQVPPASAAPGEKSWAEKELEFKQRQQEKLESAEKTKKEAAAAEQKKQNCEQSKQRVSMLESGERIYTRDAQGEREYMDDNQRQQKIEQARKAMKDWCK